MKLVLGRPVAAPLLVLALAMPCAGGDAAGLPADRGAPAPVDACAMLTDAEVSAESEASVGSTERHDEGAVEPGDYAVEGTYSATCLWKLKGEAGYVILNVMQWPKGSGQAGRFLDSFRDAAKRGEIRQTPVALQIADESLWWGDGVAARKGDRSFGVSAHLIGRRDRERGIEEALARKVASRL